MLDQPPHDAVLRRRRSRDRQGQGLRALARNRGHRLPHGLRHDVHLIDDQQRRIPPMQRSRVRGQRHQSRIVLRDHQPVLVDVRPCQQLRRQLDHPPRQVEGDTRLPLIRRDHQHLSRHVPSEHLSHRQSRSQRRLPVRPRQRHQRRADPRSERALDDLLLEVPQLDQLTRAHALRSDTELLDERDPPSRAILGEIREIQGLSGDGSLWSGLQSHLPPTSCLTM